MPVIDSSGFSAEFGGSNEEGPDRGCVGRDKPLGQGEGQESNLVKVNGMNEERWLGRDAHQRAPQTNLRELN